MDGFGVEVRFGEIVGGAARSGGEHGADLMPGRIGDIGWAFCLILPDVREFVDERDRIQFAIVRNADDVAERGGRVGDRGADDADDVEVQRAGEDLECMGTLVRIQRTAVAREEAGELRRQRLERKEADEAGGQVTSP